MKKICFCAGILIGAVSALFAAGSQGGGSSSAPAKPQGPQDPWGKYNPEITVISAKNIEETRFEAGDTIDNNPWIAKNKKDLGITIKWAWTAPNINDQFIQKQTASIAAGNLQDIMIVNAQQLDMLAQSDLIWDLTDIYEAYASPQHKQMMNIDPDQANIAKINGRLMAMPFLGSTSDTSVLWLREDWRVKLGLPEPKTIQDVLTIAEAFATKDPDGNGKNDTSGLMLSKDLFTARAGRMGEFIECFHAHPDGWVRDGSGQLGYGAVQPQVKTALAALADLYKKGYIDQDFGVLDNDRSIERILSGKAGMFFGYFALPLQVRDLETTQPGAKFVPYPLPSADSTPAKKLVNNPVITFYVVNKKFAHPEALIKMLNINYRQSYGADAEMYPYSQSQPNGYSYWQHNLVHTGYPNKNLDAHLAIKNALSSGDTGKLDAEQLRYYNHIKRYLENDKSDALNWGYERIFGPDKSVYSVMDYYVKNKLIVLNGFYGAPTESMSAYESSLKSMRDEVFTKIVMGASPIDAFDTFVRDWKRQGGDAITKEVNEWAKKR
ncbi:MAG: extracellular solute-binding protein [Spirochaetaceae bacterium]|jgi:putative aldouronate transport system substrate-binding protein|nr:extracellular solute-binding protein [Spirochaetaceae bacterium]